MNENEMNHIVKASHQRAALMGLFLAILQEEADLTIDQVKDKLVSMFATLIELGVVVDDEIDMEVAKGCRDYCKQGLALQQLKDLLN